MAEPGNSVAQDIERLETSAEEDRDHMIAMFDLTGERLNHFGQWLIFLSLSLLGSMAITLILFALMAVKVMK